MVRLEQSRAFDEKLRAVRDLLEAGTPLTLLTKTQQKLTAKYLHVNERGGKIAVTFNVEVCRQTKRCFGFFALISNRRKDPSDCLRTYRRRTPIELCFEDYKDKTGGTRPHVWSADALQGRMLVQFVALCYLEFFAEKNWVLKDSLRQEHGDETHDTKKQLDDEKKTQNMARKHLAAPCTPMVRYR